MGATIALSKVAGTKRDFFISFNKADRSWAAWIAWMLEQNEYTVFFQDWDFRGNFVEQMHHAQQDAKRTLLVLSNNYFGSAFTIAEWATRFVEDPAAHRDLLVPIKVGPLTNAGLLSPLSYADLTECEEEKDAANRLLDRVKKAVDPNYRTKPKTKPIFPPSLLKRKDKPVFPQTTQETAQSHLSFPQAKAAVGLYLDTTRWELQLKVTGFFEQSFSKHSREELLSSARHFVNHEAMQAINDNRAKVQTFTLINGMTLTQFLEEYSPVNDGIISDARRDVLSVVREAIDDGNQKIASKNNALQIIEDASSATRDRLSAKLKAIYGE
jgi:hypothetical protein